jgi:adenosine deaminase
VKYAEIRFCPALHQKEGLSLDEVVEQVVLGFHEWKDKLRGGIIICGLTSQDK